jgi:hypothetical protein
MKTQGEIPDKLTYPDELLNLKQLSFYPDNFLKLHLVRLNSGVLVEWLIDGET